MKSLLQIRPQCIKERQDEMQNFIITILSLLTVLVPCFLGVLVFQTTTFLSPLFSIPLSLAICILSFPICCGLFSIPGRHAIRPGKIKRSLSEKLYFYRRIHAIPWTVLYYSGPIYFFTLSIPWLKNIVFSLFGYQGNINFTIHPDSWIRDLPCINFGEGAYIANKASVAANMVLMQGLLLVDKIDIGKHSCVGMGAMVAPGATIGANSILETASLMGVKARLGDNVKVGGTVGIQHGAAIEDNAIIGSHSYIGIRSRIGQNVNIPDGSHIHPGVRIRNQEEADLYFSEETGALTRTKSKIRLDVVKMKSELDEKVEYGELKRSSKRA